MNSANTPMNILSYDLKLQHHNYNSPLAIKLFLVKLCRYNHVLTEWETPLSMASTCRKDPRTAETMQKGCGNGAERLRKWCGKTAETVWGLSFKEVTRKYCRDVGEKVRKDCRNIADTIRKMGSPTADVTSECTPGSPCLRLHSFPGGLENCCLGTRLRAAH